MSTRKRDTRWLVLLALFAAIEIFLNVTGIGMIPSPGLLFTDTYSPDLGFVAAYCVLAVAFLVLHFLKFNQKAHQADLEAEKAAALAAAKQE